MERVGVDGGKELRWAEVSMIRLKMVAHVH
jgi:hypothetical protein